MEESKIVYVAHPIGGNVDENLKDLFRILKILNMSDENTTFIAPYVGDVMSLDDSDIIQRRRGIKNNTALFERRIMDEMWLTGDKISSGMQEEIELCDSYQILVLNKLGQF